MLEKENNRTKEGGAEGSPEADRNGAPGSVGRAEIPRGPYWLLMEEQADGRGGYAATDGARRSFRSGIREGVFLVETGAYKVLPIFGSEEAADLFLASLDDSRKEGGHRKRKTWTAELLSALCATAYSSGLCAGVEKVALDPISHEEADGSGGGSRCMDRRCFQEHLMGRRAGWFRDTTGGSQSLG